MLKKVNVFNFKSKKKATETKAPTEDCLPQFTVIFSVPVVKTRVRFEVMAKIAFPLLYYYYFGQIFLAFVIHFFP